MKMKLYVVKLSLCLLLCLGMIQAQAQLVNDECFSAIQISNLGEFCSQGFTNAASTPSEEPAASCWFAADNGSDVWYTFRPIRQGLLLNIQGGNGVNDFNLSDYSIAVYEGRCSNLVQIYCADNSANSRLERIFTDLAIGTTHYIRVMSRDQGRGSFQICMRQFTPQPEPQQDCGTGVVLCDKSPFVVQRLEGFGAVRDEAFDSCLNGLVPGGVDQTPSVSESSSVWYKWTAANNGDLTFTLTPTNDAIDEDLDFVVYRLPDGLERCETKELIMCMASGITGLFDNADLPCLGPTGLRSGESEIVEYSGCSPGDNNFIAPLQMVEGESYALMVNNYSLSGFGFGIEFGGSGEFLGPEPDFEVTAINEFSCDRVITFVNQSTSETDPITEYFWNFGDGATPASATGIGPQDVVYETFGNKISSLTVRTSRGCQVTKPIESFVEPCCDDLADLVLDTTVQDLSCYNAGDGVISVSVTNGTPEYLYTVDDGDLTPTSTFAGLSAGAYSIKAQDGKGCEVTTNITVEQPEEIVLTLTGPTDTLMLGDASELGSFFTPLDRILTYEWSPPSGLDCIDCPDPGVIPPGTTVYTLTVTDQDGCTSSQDITVLTNTVRPFAAPNIIMLNNTMDPRNQIFKGTSNIAAEIIESISVYDRWGGQVYREENVGFDDDAYRGWDGIGRNGQKVNPGVFVWVAKVRFVDGVVLTFKGDLTVVD